MKNILLLSFFFFELSFIYGQSEDFYTPWSFKDTGQMDVSRWGHYMSLGLGGGRSKAKGEGAISELASYSVAYKSYIFSLTYAHASTLIGGENEPFLYTHYYGFLLGESIRDYNLLFSLSAGVAHGYVDVRYFNPKPTLPSNQFLGYSEESFSFPVELKLFW